MQLVWIKTGYYENERSCSLVEWRLAFEAQKREQSTAISYPFNLFEYQIQQAPTENVLVTRQR
jgi:hypothetical protein